MGRQGETGMTDTRDYGAFLLRASMGAPFIAHGAIKLFVFTPAGTARFFVSLGLPAPMAYLTMAVELLGGAALLLGVGTRYVAPVLAALLVGTIMMVHGANGFAFSARGGGWEYPAFWAVALVAQALLGDGAFALGLPRRARMAAA
jgi:putative oxidoreductase